MLGNLLHIIEENHHHYILGFLLDFGFYAPYRQWHDNVIESGKSKIYNYG